MLCTQSSRHGNGCWEQCTHCNDWVEGATLAENCFQPQGTMLEEEEEECSVCGNSTSIAPVRFLACVVPTTVVVLLLILLPNFIIAGCRH
jgi:hypothetical protein